MPVVLSIYSPSVTWFVYFHVVYMAMSKERVSQQWGKTSCHSDPSAQNILPWPQTITLIPQTLFMEQREPLLT